MVALWRFALESVGRVEQGLLVRAECKSPHSLVGLTECRHVTFIIIIEMCALSAHIASAIAPEGDLLEDALGVIRRFGLESLCRISVCCPQIAGELIIIGNGEEEVFIIHKHQLAYVVRQTQPFLCFTHAGC